MLRSSSRRKRRLKSTASDASKKISGTKSVKPLPMGLWASVTRFGEFHHFGTMFKNFGHFDRDSFNVWKNCKLLWLILYAIWQIFIALNGQKLNNLSIWSHWLWQSGRFRHHRSVVQIQPSAKFYTLCYYC